MYKNAILGSLLLALLSSSEALSANPVAVDLLTVLSGQKQGTAFHQLVDIMARSNVSNGRLVANEAVKLIEVAKLTTSPLSTVPTASRQALMVKKHPLQAFHQASRVLNTESVETNRINDRAVETLATGKVGDNSFTIRRLFVDLKLVSTTISAGRVSIGLKTPKCTRPGTDPLSIAVTTNGRTRQYQRHGRGLKWTSPRR